MKIVEGLMLIKLLITSLTYAPDTMRPYLLKHSTCFAIIWLLSLQILLTIAFSPLLLRPHNRAQSFQDVL